MEEELRLSVPANEGQNVIGQEELKTLGDGVMRSGGGSDGSGDGSDNGGDDGSGSGTPGSDYTPLYGSISDSITFGDMDWNCSGSLACYAKVVRELGTDPQDDSDYNFKPDILSATGAFTISSVEKDIIEGNKHYVLVGGSAAGANYAPSGSSIIFTNVHLFTTKYLITDNGDREPVNSSDYIVTVTVKAEIAFTRHPDFVYIESMDISII